MADLGLSSSSAEVDARALVEEHAAISKFVAMRGADPSGGEPTYGPYPRGKIKSLHVGSARAVTAWDAVENVCWLLAYNAYHRNGDPEDAFEDFNARFSSGELLPSEEDWSDFFAKDEDALYERMRQTGESLLASARLGPGHEVFETFTDGGRQVICVDIVVEDDGQAEEGWMGLLLPEDEAWSEERIYDLVAALLPEDVDPIYSMEFHGRPRHRGEVVYRWEHYSSR